MINNYNTLAVPRLLGRFLILAAALVAVRCAGAGSITLYAIGAASFGAPTDLNIMNPSLPSSVTNVQTPLDGSIGFNGGLVYNNGMIYGIGDDSYASLLSLNNKGQNLTCSTSAAHEWCRSPVSCSSDGGRGDSGGGRSLRRLKLRTHNVHRRPRRSLL